MTVPEAFAKGLAIYLMMAIGLKGGVEMSKAALGPDIAILALVALALSFLLPFLAYWSLRLTSKMDRLNAAATAGHYGSISIVTFVAGTQALQFAGIATSGHMVAIAALMEVPAIVSALILARRGLKKSGEIAGSEKGELLREVLLSASVVVLVGSLLIGWISGEAGMEKIAPFFVTPFQGVLCLFLLDMGLSAGRGLRQGWRDLNFGALSFGLYMPLISAIYRCPCGDEACPAQGETFDLSDAFPWRNFSIQPNTWHPFIYFDGSMGRGLGDRNVPKKTTRTHH